MANWFAISALVAIVIAVILLIVAVIINRKALPTDADRKNVSILQIIALVLLLVAVVLTVITTFYPHIGQRYQSGSRGAAPRATV